MEQKISIIKIGGNVIDNESALQSFLRDFASLPNPKILIHGGGKLASRLSEKLGVETKMIDGRRVTDDQTIDIVTMVYAGLVNKRIVASLSALSCPALGLCGADGNVIPSHLRSKEPIDFGWVGDICPEDINTDFIASLLQQGITPVFCAITNDGEGHLLNTNADSVATGVALACSKLGRTSLVFCLEKNGVLSDIDDPNSVIPEITPTCYVTLRVTQQIQGGMIPKVENALKAIDGGVGEVIIKHADNLLNNIGTVISK